MTQTLISNPANSSDLFYPTEDGEPLAETSLHADAIIAIVAILRNYLVNVFSDRSAVVLADQFLYYAQGFPRLRVAPDVMVIFEIPQVPYDNYKIWEVGKVPSVIFEISSSATQAQDRDYKKTLYESLGVQEYWLFDPKGEWIREKLQGYRLQQFDPEIESKYVAIANQYSDVLGLRLEVKGSGLEFFRQDLNQNDVNQKQAEKLLNPNELAIALQEQKYITNQERERAEKAEQEAQQLRDRLSALGIDV
jgi:Uma2 family endonuclease